ncbi:MAG: hypothetical protein N4A47_03840 [Clostridia bacterium]|jgi:hypothetical protein|nr:hypothetical protein [Clostridia bacterium]
MKNSNSLIGRLINSLNNGDMKFLVEDVVVVKPNDLGFDIPSYVGIVKHPQLYKIEGHQSYIVEPILENVETLAANIVPEPGLKIVKSDPYNKERTMNLLEKWQRGPDFDEYDV